MPEKTYEERLLGAACFRLGLERRSTSAAMSIYRSVLIDLGLSEKEVAAFLAANRDKVEAEISRRENR